MSKILKRLYIFLIFAFMYLPIAVLIVFSFNESRVRGHWTGFSLQWYKELFSDSLMMRALYNTLLIAIVSTIISTIIGTFAAIGINYSRPREKRLILGINQIPVLNPDIVTAISLMIIFKLMQFESGYLTLLLSHVVFSIPYVIINILPKLKTMNSFLPEAAMDLGAKPLQVVFKVIIPEIKTGIISGALMAFTLSIDDFVISFFNTGNGVQTVSTIVYSMVKKGINPTINALSTIMFAMVFVLLVIVYLKTDNEEE